MGGGYAERKSQLAKLPLKWLIDETRALGLLYKDDTIRSLVLGEDKKGRYVAPDGKAPRNRSMNWAWAILEFIPRIKTKYCLSKRPAFLWLYLPFFERRYVPLGSKVHSSVFERRGTSTDYDQPNIPDDHTVV
ncbi:hypothetical protein [Roseovarius rhodophyticola]|uniref:Uncharacterized protein n=1 Tax=Roseovarius rhodophyticola TaxID=3080827 RepID=A0ABZ2TH51_9RHOB|nr:hypothetical protein [Roseovarius sp. W115]MDV2929209.1 hypothetical protein [Roseovarius sp. W115]